MYSETYLHRTFLRPSYVFTVKPVYTELSWDHLMCLEWTCICFIPVKLTKMSHIGTLFKVQFIQDFRTLKVMWGDVITLVSVIIVVVCKFLHFNLLLWNRYSNWNQAWQECSLDGPLQNVCFFFMMKNPLQNKWTEDSLKVCSLCGAFIFQPIFMIFSYVHYKVLFIYYTNRFCIVTRGSK